MTVSLTCTRCHETIEATDEDELVSQVQTHVRTHGSHPVSRRHVLNRLRREEAQHGGETPQPAPPGAFARPAAGDITGLEGSDSDG